MVKISKKSKSSASDREFWSRFWLLLKPFHKQIWVMLFLTIFLEGFRLIGPYLLKIIIDKLTAFSAQEIKDILWLILIMLISEQSVSVVHYFRDRKLFGLLFSAESYLHVKAQQKLVYLSLDYHERENTGNKIIKIEKGVGKILELIGNVGWEVVPTIVQVFVTVLAMFFIDWRLAVSLAAFLPIFIWITYYSNSILYPIRKKRYQNYERASGKIVQTIININTVKSFVQEKREAGDYKARWRKIRDRALVEWFRLIKYWLIRNFIVNLGRTAILLLGVYLVWQGNISLGALVFVITLSEKVYHSMYRLSRFYDRVEEGNIAVSRFIGLTREEQDIKSPKNGIKPKIIRGKIEFKEVNFKYQDSRAKALNKISLKINSGCVTALVGPSGGGKTTVARMIYRHYDPQSGKILLDDKDIKDYNLYGFRKFIAIVPQEVEVFNSSIRDNIAYSKPSAGFKEVQAAARVANAEEFIDKLPEKYNAEVGEQGIKLSGGQRQRVGIARAILANPRILIFDEATSNLDSYSERLIQKAMDKISRGRTVIMIAHRLSTIKKADKIIVLEDGQVVEEGNHLELARASGGLYAKLLKLQELGDVE